MTSKYLAWENDDRYLINIKKCFYAPQLRLQPRQVKYLVRSLSVIGTFRKRLQKTTSDNIHQYISTVKGSVLMDVRYSSSVDFSIMVEHTQQSKVLFVTE